jgi:hypothetical protein
MRAHGVRGHGVRGHDMRGYGVRGHDLRGHGALPNEGLHIRIDYGYVLNTIHVCRYCGLSVPNT